MPSYNESHNAKNRERRIKIVILHYTFLLGNDQNLMWKRKKSNLRGQTDKWEATMDLNKTKKKVKKK